MFELPQNKNGEAIQLLCGIDVVVTWQVSNLLSSVQVRYPVLWLMPKWSRPLPVKQGITGSSPVSHP
jgi:hypothetical protein